MTLREKAKGVVTSGDGTYRIGFVNNEGREDETELDAFNLQELQEVYSEFCKENNFKQNTVLYVERV